MAAFSINDHEGLNEFDSFAQGDRKDFQTYTLQENPPALGEPRIGSPLLSESCLDEREITQGFWAN